MSLRKRQVVLVATWLVSLTVANYVGGVIGFRQGYATELALSGHDALNTVTVLRQLRAGMTENAIVLLESQLDAHIASAVFGVNEYDSIYNLHLRLVFGNNPVEGNAWALSSVLPYREEVSFRIDDAELRARMMTALAAYRGAPNPWRSRRGNQ